PQWAVLRRGVGVAVVGQHLGHRNLTGLEVVVAEGKLLRNRTCELRLGLRVHGSVRRNVVLAETGVGSQGLARNRESVIHLLRRIGIVEEVVVRITETRGSRCGLLLRETGTD